MDGLVKKSATPRRGALLRVGLDRPYRRQASCTDHCRRARRQGWPRPPTVASHEGRVGRGEEIVVKSCSISISFGVNLNLGQVPVPLVRRAGSTQAVAASASTKPGVAPVFNLVPASHPRFARPSGVALLGWRLAVIGAGDECRRFARDARSQIDQSFALGAHIGRVEAILSVRRWSPERVMLERGLAEYCE